MKIMGNRWLTLAFLLALTGTMACDGQQGCGGTGDGSQYCGPGTRWDGTQCVKV